jgi:hypothetical protein
MRASLYLLVLGFIFSTSCKTIECLPCDTVTCGEFQECVEGKCQCLPDSWDMGTYCFPRNFTTYSTLTGDPFPSNTSYYSTSKCQCLDTMVVYIDTARYPPRMPPSNFVIPIQMKCFYASRKLARTGDLTAAYYPLADGDSFVYVNPGIQIFGNRYSINGQDVKPTILGKFTPKKDTMRWKILWKNRDYVVLDSCTKIFTR